MDPVIMDNTKMYAKSGEIYVAKNDPHELNSWRAVLVDSFCQAGKTNKCFDILCDKIIPNTLVSNTLVSNTLVLFITQANSSASAEQTLQRAMTSPNMNDIIPAENIFRSNKRPIDGVVDGNYMIVDFWNSRNMANMIDFVKETRCTFASIVVVLDECEQGHTKGLHDRLSFVRKIEKSSPRSIVKVIFVTATVANLSKSILRIQRDNLDKFNKSIVSEIINKPVVEHQFVEPHPTYVGASWFKDTPDVWKKLTFEKKPSEMTKDEYIELKQRHVMTIVKALPDDAKELTLIVTSTRTCDHRSLAERLYRSGYNVTVELNGTNSKNFKVKYVDKSGGISSWDIPSNAIDTKADRGDLETYRNCDKKVVKSGITQKEDYTMSHVLQAALFMATSAETRIKQHTTPYEFAKLEALNNAISNMYKSSRRPEDYPENPRVALIAGHLAGRGVTIQNPAIDFTCTSFCFTGTSDVVQRGATNTQRFGRACGMLMDIFARDGRQPILIATEGIVRDALANEAALREKAESIENGTLISLKDMITNEEWNRIMRQTKDEVREKSDKVRRHDHDSELIDGVSMASLKHYYKSKNLLIGKMIRYLYECEGRISFDEFKNGIGYTKTDKQFQNNLDGGRGIHCKYGKLWTCEDGMIAMNQSIKDALSNMSIK